MKPEENKPAVHKPDRQPDGNFREVTTEIVDEESSSRYGRRSMGQGPSGQQTVYMEMHSGGCGCGGCLLGCLLVLLILLGISSCLSALIA